MTKNLYFFLFLTACTSSHKEMTVNEINYNSVSDSLVKYKNEIKASSGTMLPTMSDYMKMDYASYKSKYKLSDKEMTDLAQTFSVSYQIARTMKEIGENTNNITDTADSLCQEIQHEKSDYRFDPDQSNEVENGSELDVLMEADDSDVQPTKKKAIK